MLPTLKRWLSHTTASAWAEVQAWAQAHGHRFAPAREGQGFIVDGSLAAQPWRLEWGPPQRAYIHGHELRIRMELGLPAGMQMLLLSRPLMAALERDIFQRSTEDVQTNVDMSTPEEMRWLSMFVPAELATQAALRAHFGGVSSQPALLGAWVADDLAERLEAVQSTLLQAAPPFLLMTLRGRLYLRLELDAPTATAVEQAVHVFDAAVLSALQVAAAVRNDGDGWPAAGGTAWQTQYPGDPG